MKPCPFCAEQIQEAAIKCRFCGEFLDESSLSEAFVKRQTDREVFNAQEVADYLRLPVETITDWVKRKKMPFSKLPGNRVVFHKKQIDKWIQNEGITEYDRYVVEKKTLDDILPPGYKPPTDEEIVGDYIRELHEKWITKACKKHGWNEVEHAKHLKKTFAGLSVRAPDKTRVVFDWDFKKKKYKIKQGEDAYKKFFKKDEKFQDVLVEMSSLMRYLCACY